MTVPHEPVYSLLALYCGPLSLDHRADHKLRLVLENEAIGQDTGTRHKKNHSEPFPYFHYSFLATLLTRTFSLGVVEYLEYDSLGGLSYSHRE